jgi:hypothetical protein
MVIWTNTRTVAALAVCIGVVLCSSCGTSSEGSRYLMQHGVADSGYPPKGAGTDPGSPAISSMGEGVAEKGIEAEPAKVPAQNIPPSLAATPRT